jgi:hypothetical protein
MLQRYRWKAKFEGKLRVRLSQSDAIVKHVQIKPKKQVARAKSAATNSGGVSR